MLRVFDLVSLVSGEVCGTVKRGVYLLVVRISGDRCGAKNENYRLGVYDKACWSGGEAA